MSRTRRHSFEPATLSPDGALRRDRVLSDLHAALDRRLARKRAVRTGAGIMFVVALAAGVVSVVWASRPAATPLAPAPETVAIDPAPAPSTPSPAQSVAAAKRDPEPASLVSILTTDADVVRRLAPPAHAASVEIISDSALQTELASAGVDPGLVTIGGRMLVTLASGRQSADPRP